MKFRTFITKSKAGHYTVTLRTDCLTVKRGLIDNLDHARSAVPVLLQELESEAARVCGGTLRVARVPVDA